MRIAVVDVDTGLLVYNDRTYPLFIRLLEELGVATQPSTMSFSYADARSGFEWKGSSLNSVFAQRRNLLHPGLWRMLVDIVSFNRAMRAVDAIDSADHVTLADVLATGSRAGNFVSATWCHWARRKGRPVRTPSPRSRRGPSPSSLSATARDAWPSTLGRRMTGGSRRYVEEIERRLRERGVEIVPHAVRNAVRNYTNLRIVGLEDVGLDYATTLSLWRKRSRRIRNELVNRDSTSASCVCGRSTSPTVRRPFWSATSPTCNWCGTASPRPVVQSRRGTLSLSLEWVRAHVEYRR